MTEDEDTLVRQYRKRVKGFAKYTSYDNGEDEFVEIPDECPNVCSASGVFLEPMTFTEPEGQTPRRKYEKEKTK